MTTSSNTGDEQAEHGRLEVLEQLVDDLVGPDLDVGLGRHLPGPPVGTDVEADDGGVGGLGQLHVVLGDPAHAPVDEAELHVVALELAQALGDRLERAPHVGLQDQVERGRLAPLDLLEQVLELGPAQRRGGRRHVAGHPVAVGAGLADGAGLGQLRGHPELVAGLGRLGEPEHLDRGRRRRLLDLVAVVVDQGLDLAPGGAGHDRVAHPQGAALAR